MRVERFNVAFSGWQTITIIVFILSGDEAKQNMKAKSLAVDKTGKLAITWGEMRN